MSSHTTNNHKNKRKKTNKYIGMGVTAKDIPFFNPPSQSSQQVQLTSPTKFRLSSVKFTSSTSYQPNQHYSQWYHFRLCPHSYDSSLRTPIKSFVQKDQPCIPAMLLVWR